MSDWKQLISDTVEQTKNTLENLECICNDSFERMPEAQRIEFESTITQIATEAKDTYGRLDDLLGSIESS